MSRKRGRIILVGVVGLSLDRADFYEKELSFQVSCSYGPGRYDSNYEVEGNDYPIGFVRWTEQRNFEAVLDLMASKALNIKPLISNRFDFINAADAYTELTKNSSALGILLDYNSSPSERDISSVKLDYHRKVSTIQPTFGIIGAGNYASRVLIPAFVKTNVNLHTLATANGINSIVHGKSLGFAEASSDTSSIFKNKEINTVVIITQHDSHAGFVIEGLNADKNVWVEKPLAIDLVSLDAIKSAYYNALERGALKSNSPQLMVGFNRRFSPHIIKMKSLLSSQDGPKVLVMTVNAGEISVDHWTQDPLVGGGRIIGEGCHFIDLLRFLIGFRIAEFSATKIGDSPGVKVRDDKVTITLTFEDGSFGTIHYLSNGGKTFPKERLEVFCNGGVLQLDNFKRMKGFGWKGFKKMSLISQDKGQYQCVKMFVDSIEKGEQAPISFEDIYEVSKYSIEISNYLATT
jgi:predicted dehydrogenase